MSVVSREIDRRTPTAAKLTTSEVPPALTNGSVMPVTGRRATTTPMLMNAWTHSQIVIPAASRPPNASGACRAVRIPATARTTNRPITIAAPTNPNCSPMIAKMKSFQAFGRTSPLWSWLSPSPLPNSPPSPSAISPWIVW
jgi:hypothetical protein